jgi:hypothetical protein
MQLFICNKSHCLHLHHHKWAHAPSILLRFKLFICSKSHCLHLHHQKWAHAPSILLRFKLLTLCHGPPPPSTWTQPPVCGDIGGRWRHEGVSKIEDTWSMGCLLKSYLNRPNTIGVGIEGKGYLHRLELCRCRQSLASARTDGTHADARLHPRGRIVSARTEFHISADGRCLHGRSSASAQMGGVCADKWYLSEKSSAFARTDFFPFVGKIAFIDAQHKHLDKMDVWMVFLL